MNKHFQRIAFTLLAATAVSSALAQATITQAKAEAGNVTPGDGAGFPVTISKAGSYKLMSNLVVPAGIDGIAIAADNVQIDLNGFSILGSGSCTRDSGTYAVTCVGGGDGVVMTYSPANSAVRNGTVTGFSHGVRMEGGMADNLNVRQNTTGVYAACADLQGLLMSRIVATNNHIGIHACADSMISQSALSANGTGIEGTSGANAVSESQVFYNQIGVKDSAVRATRFYGNKTDQSGNVSY
jgi:uncharacterized cupredoxin-like copper-binding protein